MLRFAAAIALFPLLTNPGLALAVDGVIEISQTGAIAGTIDNTPGFPVVITSPGNYRLTSDLSPGSMLGAIQISTSDVTIDLNGFTIRGGWVDPASCGSSISGAGIYADASYRAIAVLNGRVRNMGVHGVVLQGEGNRIERVNAAENCVSGLWVGNAGLVSDSQALRNKTGHGIVVHDGGIVTRSIAGHNGLVGILGNGVGAHVSDSTALMNGGDGINNFAGVVARSISRSNGQSTDDGVGIRTSLAVESSTVGNDRGIVAGSVAFSTGLDGANSGIVASNILGCSVNNGVKICP